MIDNIRYPNINGATVGEQLQQIKNYLFQLTEQLNVVLSSIDADIRDVSSTEASSDNIEQDSDVLYSGEETLGNENFTCDYNIYRDGTFDVYVSGTHTVASYGKTNNVYYANIDFMLPSIFGTQIEFDSLTSYHFAVNSGWGNGALQLPFEVPNKVRLTIFNSREEGRDVGFFCHIKGKYS